MRGRRNFLGMASMGLVAGLMGVLASSAGAATVTLATDNNTTGSVPGELRYEVQNAAPGETVTIAPGVNPALSPPGAVIGGGQLLIDKNLTIAGQGANLTTISVPAFGSRILMIPSMAPAPVVTIRDLRMLGGRAGDGGTGSNGGNGGAIHTSGNLTLNRVQLTANRAGNGGAGTVGMPGNPSGTPGGPGGHGGFGGAVFNTAGGVLTVISSTFDSNAAGDGGDGGNGGNGGGMFPAGGTGGAGGLGRDGGAIHNSGALTVTNSTFNANFSGSGGAGGNTGEIFGAGGVGGDSGDGGAIHQAGAGSLTLINTTIAGNGAAAGGPGGTSFIGSASPGADGDGGGTFVFNAVTPVIVNTLYSQNISATASPNCGGGGPVTSQGSNLSFPAAGGCPGSFSNGNPQLGTLGNNGGPTQTMALGTGSAAIDATGTGLATDQRGTARPQGNRCDIGAFEAAAATVPGTTCAGPPAMAASPPPSGPGGTPASTKKCKKKRKKHAGASKRRRGCRKKRKR